MQTINVTIEKSKLLSDLAREKRSFSDVEVGKKLRKIDEKFQGKGLRRFFKMMSLLSLIIAPFFISRNP